MIYYFIGGGIMELIELGVCKYRFGVVVNGEPKIRCKLKGIIQDIHECLNCEDRDGGTFDELR